MFRWQLRRETGKYNRSEDCSNFVTIWILRMYAVGTFSILSWLGEIPLVLGEIPASPGQCFPYKCYILKWRMSRLRQANSISLLFFFYSFLIFTRDKQREILKIKLSDNKDIPKVTGYCLYFSFDSNVSDVRIITETTKPLHYL